MSSVICTHCDVGFECLVRIMFMCLISLLIVNTVQNAFWQTVTANDMGCYCITTLGKEK